MGGPSSNCQGTPLIGASSQLSFERRRSSFRQRPVGLCLVSPVAESSYVGSQGRPNSNIFLASRPGSPSSFVLRIGGSNHGPNFSANSCDKGRKSVVGSSHLATKR